MEAESKNVNLESTPDKDFRPEDGPDGSALSEDDREAAVEAILFATGRAVSLEDLSKALKLGEVATLTAVRNLMEKWNGAHLGTEIIELEGSSYQMRTRKAYYPQLVRLELNPKKPKLSGALLETLSVIAYKQPVTKAEIEHIRGVNSDNAVNRLVGYNLVRELGRAKLPGRPILFGTTDEFLRLFGVSSTEDLPEMNPEIEEEFRKEAEEEAEVRTEN